MHIGACPDSQVVYSFATDCSLSLISFQCWGYFRQKQKGAKVFDNRLNPVISVFIEKLLPSTHGSGFQSFFSGFLHHFVLAKN